MVHVPWTVQLVLQHCISIVHLNMLTQVSPHVHAAQEETGWRQPIVPVHP